MFPTQSQALNGQVLTVTDGLSNITQTMGYGTSGTALGQVVSVSETDGSVTTSAITTPNGTARYGYSDYLPLGDPSKGSRAFQTMNVLDSGGNPTSEEFHYQYDQLGRVVYATYLAQAKRVITRKPRSSPELSVWANLGIHAHRKRLVRSKPSHRQTALVLSRLRHTIPRGAQLVSGRLMVLIGGAVVVAGCNSAPPITCIGNLQNLAKGYLHYAADHDGFFPLYRLNNPGTEKFQVQKCKKALVGYVKEESFFCPQDFHGRVGVFHEWGTYADTSYMQTYTTNKYLKDRNGPFVFRVETMQDTSKPFMTDATEIEGVVGSRTRESVHGNWVNGFLIDGTVKRFELTSPEPPKK